MRFLLIHQNFPGQFRQLVPFLSERGHEVVGICSHERPLPPITNVQILRYKEPKPISESLPGDTKLWHEALTRSQAVARLCIQLKKHNWVPDAIGAHCGWGETLCLKTIWPHTPQIIWPELWMQPMHLGYGIDPLLPKLPEPAELSQLGRNLLTKLALNMADQWVLPTKHQANSFPQEFKTDKMIILHEGIDAKNIAKPNPTIRIQSKNDAGNQETPILTFINRQLERLRGFDTFMRALPSLQNKHKNLQTYIVGDNDAGYGPPHPSGRTLKDIMLEELDGNLDLTRIHFLGRIPHPRLIQLLQTSTVHVYLSYPFILGWSLIEAMACECCIVGSEGAPVGEVIENRREGLLIPRDDHVALAENVNFLLKNHEIRKKLGKAARQRALMYDQRLMLPQIASLFEELASQSIASIQPL